MALLAQRTVCPSARAKVFTGRRNARAAIVRAHSSEKVGAWRAHLGQRRRSLIAAAATDGEAQENEAPAESDIDQAQDGEISKAEGEEEASSRSAEDGKEQDTRERWEVLMDAITGTFEMLGTPEGAEEDPQEVCAELKEQVQGLNDRAKRAEEREEALEKELSGLKETSKRLSADFDNFKRRAAQEKEEMSTKERAKVMESLLPIIDDFERARNQVKPETEGEEKIANGYQTIYSTFVSHLKDLGLQAIDTENHPFDPEVHEAVLREHSEEVPEDYVMQELRKGFQVNGTLIRPAMVKVSQGSESGSDSAQSQSEDAASSDEGGDAQENDSGSSHEDQSA